MARQKRLKPVSQYLKVAAPRERGNKAVIQMFEEMAKSGGVQIVRRKLEK